MVSDKLDDSVVLVEVIARGAVAECQSGCARRVVACRRDHMLRTVEGLIRHQLQLIPQWYRLLMRNDLFNDRWSAF